jgi:hypothetical protein
MPARNQLLLDRLAMKRQFFLQLRALRPEPPPMHKPAKNSHVGFLTRWPARVE